VPVGLGFARPACARETSKNRADRIVSGKTMTWAAPRGGAVRISDARISFGGALEIGLTEYGTDRLRHIQGFLRVGERT